MLHYTHRNMKTNNLKRKSFLTSLILLATAAFTKRSSGGIKDTSGSRTGGMFWNPQAIFIPRRTKFKGWMRENRKYRTNKTK
jgi:hypothetical protein